MEFNSQYLKENKKATLEAIDVKYRNADMGLVKNVVEACILLGEAVGHNADPECTIDDLRFKRGCVRVERKNISAKNPELMARVLRMSTMYDMYAKLNGNVVLELTFLK